MTKLASQLSKQLGNRFHGELQGARIRYPNFRFLKQELKARLFKLQSWEAIVKRNHWFQEFVVEQLKSEAVGSSTVVFSYSYAALKAFEFAKSRGSKLVLGQIDPGPFEWNLVDEIHRKHGIPPHDHPPESYWEDWKRECDLSDFIVVNSSWSRRALINQAIPSEKIRVIPLSYEVPSEVRSRERVENQTPGQFSPKRKLQILYLGQVIARKGVVELADAMERLQDQPVDLTVVGSGDQELMKRLSRLPNVNCTGQVVRSDVVEFYQNSDLFILPTHSDGFAITLLEAAAFGLPIVASPFCGDVVKHGKNGLVLNEVSADEIVKAIQQILDEPTQLISFANDQKDRDFLSLDSLGHELISLGT